MIKELNQKIQSRELSCLDLNKEYLAIIKEKNESLRAFLEVYEKEVLAQAEAVDKKVNRKKKIGLLEGIPYGLKDNVCLQGKRTSAGSRMLNNYQAVYDATVVKKLKEAGAIVMGKTNMDEFAMGSSTESSVFGPTKNPWDESRVPGGSSGGSAAAVAAEMVPWALGSDTGGSIRQPAGFCGVVGFKPTYGRVSRYGLIAMASSYDQIGPLAKTVEDVALIYQVIKGKDVKDNTTIEKSEADLEDNFSLKGKKIGIVKEFFDSEGLDKKVKTTVEKRIEFAKEQGVEIIEVKLDYFKHSLAVYYIMMTAEISSNLARMDGIRFGFNESLEKDAKAKDILDVYNFSREMALGPESKRRVILGTYVLSAGYYDAYYKKAQKIREIIKQEVKKVFEQVDVLISPTSPKPAFKLGEKISDPLQLYLEDIYTVGANVAMIPGISIPAGIVSEDGKDLPVGLQLLGRWWEDEKLLSFAKALEL
ncbi:MAG TPA: Asp-tRNA(Asn)/Glu-tRNA(Gln) amidotransferase subunit GatA [Candidatus Moranbacteria bacterium]|nr:Asp-tRNA(Asn)/Glu-tRNA(Gln) amidotransferase subunit GatA [Candidatus Moranbacteria bacterium]